MSGVRALLPYKTAREKAGHECSPVEVAKQCQEDSGLDEGDRDGKSGAKVGRNEDPIEGLQQKANSRITSQCNDPLPLSPGVN